MHNSFCKQNTPVLKGGLLCLCKLATKYDVFEWLSGGNNPLEGNVIQCGTEKAETILVSPVLRYYK